MTDTTKQTVYSDAARLTIKNAKPVITSQPGNVTCVDGATAKFTIMVASTADSLTYLWQYRDSSSSTWIDSASGKTNTYTFTASASRSGCMVRCLVSTPGWQIVSQTAYLTVSSAHTHSWSSSTEVVYVPDQGHYETVTVTDKEAYDEQVWVVDKAAWTEKVAYHLCNCGRPFINNIEFANHAYDYCGSDGGSRTMTVPVYHDEQGHYKTVHHAAVTHTEQKWVVDVPAHTETRTVQKCKTCGVTK